jgi:predicted transcriptional regulator
MTPKITPEQRAALDNSGGPVPVEDAETNRVYFLVDASTFDALRREQDRAAIREGLADIHAGRVAPLDEAVARIRANLGLTKES